jgi:hypothetical protein
MAINTIFKYFIFAFLVLNSNNVWFDHNDDHGRCHGRDHACAFFFHGIQQNSWKW